MNNKLFFNLCLVFPISTGAFAVDTETNTVIASPLTLDSIDITGEKLKTESISHITQEQIQDKQIQSLADLYRNETSVSVGGGSTSAQRVYVRGVESSNLNVTVDGASQGRNLFQHRGNSIGIDASLLKEVDVSTHPSSDQGAGALGGSITYTTVDAQDLLKEGETIGGSIETGYESASDAKSVSVNAFGIVGKHLGVLAHVKEYDSENYESGDGTEVKGTAEDNSDYFIKLNSVAVKDHELSVSFERNTNSGDYRYGAGDTAYNADADLDYQKYQRETATINHTYNPAENSLINLKSNLYNNNVSLENITSSNYTESTSVGGGVKNTSLFSLGSTENELSYGVDYIEETGTYTTSGTQTGGDNKSTNLGLFVQEELFIGAAQVSLGARYDHFDTDYGSSSLKGDEISPSMNVNYEVIPNLNVFAGYGEAVRSTGVVPIQWLARATDTLTFNQDSTKNSYNTALKPEISARREVGARFKTAIDNALFQSVSVTVTAFNTEIENLIQQVGGTQGQSVSGFYNDDPIISKGYEASLRLNSKHLSTSLSFSKTDMEDEDGNAIAVVRRVGASTGDQYSWDTQWHSDDKRISLGYNLQYTDDIKTDSFEREGYITHGINSSWKPQEMQDLTLSFAVVNLFDENYVDQTTIGDDDTGIYEAGRNIKLSAKYTF